MFEDYDVDFEMGLMPFPLSGNDKGQDYLMGEFGFIPVVDGMTSQGLDPLSQDVATYAADGKTISWANTYWPAGIVDVHLKPITEEFFTTSMTGTEFVRKIGEAFVEAGQ